MSGNNYYFIEGSNDDEDLCYEAAGSAGAAAESKQRISITKDQCNAWKAESCATEVDIVTQEPIPPERLIRLRLLDRLTQKSKLLCFDVSSLQRFITSQGPGKAIQVPGYQFVFTKGQLQKIMSHQYQLPKEEVAEYEALTKKRKAASISEDLAVARELEALEAKRAIAAMQDAEGSVYAGAGGYGGGGGYGYDYGAQYGGAAGGLSMEDIIEQFMLEEQFGRAAKRPRAGAAAAAAAPAAVRDYNRRFNTKYREIKQSLDNKFCDVVHADMVELCTRLKELQINDRRNFDAANEKYKQLVNDIRRICDGDSNEAGGGGSASARAYYRCTGEAAAAAAAAAPAALVVPMPPPARDYNRRFNTKYREIKQSLDDKFCDVVHADMNELCTRLRELQINDRRNFDAAYEKYKQLVNDIKRTCPDSDDGGGGGGGGGSERAYYRCP